MTSARQGFHVALLSWEEARERARVVREAVFIVEQNVPRELEWDEWDAVSVHALALAGAEVIGTARLLPDGHLGRMAVLRDWRRRGVGSALACALIERAWKDGMGHIVLHAQTHAEAFYRQLGFEREGDVFDEAGIPHVRMTLSRAGLNARS